MKKQLKEGKTNQIEIKDNRMRIKIQNEATDELLYVKYKGNMMFLLKK